MPGASCQNCEECGVDSAVMRCVCDNGFELLKDGSACYDARNWWEKLWNDHFVVAVVSAVVVGCLTLVLINALVWQFLAWRRRSLERAFRRMK